jgi:FG-GAP-like repeat/FG-GAP repeat
MRSTLMSLTRSLFLSFGLAALVGCGGDGVGVGPSETPSNASYESVAVADLNNDGKLDIVTSFFVGTWSNPASGGYVAVYLHDASSASTFNGPTNYLVGNDPTAIAIADLNGDGEPDIVAISFAGSSKNVSVLLQDGKGSGHFLPAANYTLSQPGAVAIADINLDGKLDLAVNFAGGVAIFLQDSSGTGTFLPPTTIHAGGGEVALVAADMNGDDKPDLVVPYLGILVLLQDPAVPGKFFNPVTYSTGGIVWGLASGDLNGDDDPDIVAAYSAAANDNTSPGISILLQNPASPGTFLPATNLTTVNGFMASVTIRDLNEDGKPDLAVANLGGLTCSGMANCQSTGSKVAVLLQDPAQPGVFRSPVNYATTNDGVMSLATGDMNGDGRPDLVLAYSSAGIVIRFQSSTSPGTFLGETFITQ